MSEHWPWDETTEAYYDKGVKDAIAFFKSEFAKWEACQYGHGKLCLTFNEMLREARKLLRAH